MSGIDGLRIVRVYHAGRASSHRARDRALVAAGVRLRLIVPSNWSESGAEPDVVEPGLDVVELPVVRPDDVNRHRYVSAVDLQDAILGFDPDALDMHEEPFSRVMRQALDLVPRSLPVVAYAAQNVDKRFPPPFPQWERAAYGRLAALYPCSRQAAAVARVRGYNGLVEVIDLGYDPAVFRPGEQTHDSDELVVALVGRLVPEKGVADAVRAVAAVSARPVRLVVAGSGPLADDLVSLAAAARLDRLDMHPWLSSDEVAALYRRAHVVLVPSQSTRRWVEQYGRMIVEAQACGAVVVGYASGSIPEVSRGAAVLLAEGDERGLVRALAQLARDAELWTRLRAAGVQASARATWAAVAEQQASLYRRAVETPLPPLPGPRRLESEQEFGATARLAGDVRRPFALPGLRDVPALARALDRHR